NYCEVLQYLWDFGDGNVASTSAANTTHQYASSGSYTVTVTMYTQSVGGQMCSDSYSQTVVVTSCQDACDDCNLSLFELVAEFDADCEGLFTVAMTYNPTYCEVGDFVWDFGDGSQPFTSPYQSLAFYNYAEPGVYPICVTMHATTIPGGSPCTASYCDMVEVPACSPANGQRTASNANTPLAEELELLQNQNITFFPNPVQAGSQLTITIPEGVRTLELRDLAGRLLGSHSLPGQGVQQLSVPDELAAGIYLLSSPDGGIAPTRIVVSHP
ncbi:MAG: PKD domain-containing protein, partial [Bacteroidota bacterium]